MAHTARSPRFLVLGAAILIAIVAWFAGSASPPQAPADTTPAPTGEVEDETAVASRGAQPPADATTPRRATTPAVATTTPAPDESPTDRLPVLVIDVATAEQVAGAEVRFARMDADRRSDDFDERLERSQLRQRDQEAWLLAVGESTVTDADGRCSIPFEHFVTVCARAGDRYAEAMVRDRPAGPLVLALAADLRLDVEVVDALGVPAADVDIVAIATRADGQRERDVLATTDADGRAVITHAQRHARAGETRQLSITAAALGGEAAPIAIDLDAPPRAPLRFALPPTGSMTVRLVAREGASRDVLAFLTRDRRLTLSLEAAPDRTWVRWLDRAGTHTFPHVVTGQRFHARAGDLHPTPIAVAGPTTAGEHVDADVPLPDTGVEIAARAVDAVGHPHARRMLQFNFSHAEAHHHTVVETAADGRFVARLRSLEPGSRPALRMKLWPVGDRPERNAAITPTSPLTAGRNEFGDVIFDVAPRICTGTVVDQDGRPASDPPLTVYRYDAQDWHWLATELTTPEPGRFEIRGHVEPGRLRLASGAITAFVEPQEFALGATDLHVVVTWAGELPFTLLVDDSTPWTELEIGLRAHAPHREQAMRVAGDGRIAGRLSGLRPGSHDLLIRLPFADDPLVTVAGIDVPAGGVADDPRLAAIDLRGVCTTAFITARADDGAPLQDLLALIRDPRDDAVSTFVAIEPRADGRLPIPVGTAPVDVTLVAAGRAPLQRRVHRDDIEVFLVTMPELTVVFDGLDELPAGLHAVARATPAADNPLAAAMLRGRRSYANFADDGFHARQFAVPAPPFRRLDGHMLRCAPRHPGGHRLELTLVAGDGADAPVELGAGADVVWSPGVERRVVAVPRPALDAALAALRR